MLGLAVCAPVHAPRARWLSGAAPSIATRLSESAVAGHTYKRKQQVITDYYTSSTLLPAVYSPETPSLLAPT